MLGELVLQVVFTVDYLGAEVTQVGLNYSRPAAQILGQYYNFIRLGFEGYRNVQYKFETEVPFLVGIDEGKNEAAGCRVDVYAHLVAGLGIVFVDCRVEG